MDVDLLIRSRRRVRLAGGLRGCKRNRFAGAVGVTFFGRVMLSPVLFSTQRQRMPAILTHELSHAHIRSWISELTYIRLRIGSRKDLP